MLIPLTFAAALVIGLIVTPIVRGYAQHRGLLAQPGGRKVHEVPIPRLGGVATAIAIAVAIGGATLVNPDLGSTLGLRPNRAPAILAGVGLLLVVGIVDDVRGMRALTKLAFQVVAAVLAWGLGRGSEPLCFPCESGERG